MTPPAARQPRTAAGRALHTWLLQHEGPDALLSPGAEIVAIEEQAAALDVERLARALRALDDEDWPEERAAAIAAAYSEADDE